MWGALRLAKSSLGHFFLHFWGLFLFCIFITFALFLRFSQILRIFFAFFLKFLMFFETVLLKIPYNSCTGKKEKKCEKSALPSAPGQGLCDSKKVRPEVWCEENRPQPTLSSTKFRLCLLRKTIKWRFTTSVTRLGKRQKKRFFDAKI